MYSVYNAHIKGQNVLVAKIGLVDQSFINSTLTELKEHKANYLVPHILYKKIYGIITELLENIKRHGVKEQSSKMPMGYLVVALSEYDITIFSGNLVSLDDQIILFDLISVYFFGYSHYYSNGELSETFENLYNKGI